MNYSTILHIHTMIGAVVLTSFWITAFSKKGGRVHRFSGKIYLVGILIIIVSVIPMIVLALQRNNNKQAIGLAFLSVMTFVAGMDRVPGNCAQARHRNLSQQDVCSIGACVVGVWIADPCTQYYSLVISVRFFRFYRTYAGRKHVVDHH